MKQTIRSIGDSKEWWIHQSKAKQSKAMRLTHVNIDVGLWFFYLCLFFTPLENGIPFETLCSWFTHNGLRLATCWRQKKMLCLHSNWHVSIHTFKIYLELLWFAAAAYSKARIRTHTWNTFQWNESIKINACERALRLTHFIMYAWICRRVICWIDFC